MKNRLSSKTIQNEYIKGRSVKELSLKYGVSIPAIIYHIRKKVL